MKIKTILGELVELNMLRKIFAIRGYNDKYNVLAEFDNGDTIVLNSFETKSEADNYLLELFK